MTSLRLALRRLRARPLLSTLLLFGLALAVAVPVAIPVYADAATSRVLATQDFQDIGYRPPFSFLYWYSAPLDGPLSWSDAEPVDDYLRNEGLDSLGLPPKTSTSFIETERYEFESHVPGANPEFVSLAALDDLNERVRVIDGSMFGLSSDEGSDVIEIVMPADLAETLAVGPGDTVRAVDTNGPEDGPYRTLTLEITGIWEPLDPSDALWIIDPSQLNNRVFVDRSVITDTLSPQRPELIRTAAWYTILDSSKLTARGVDDIIAGSLTVTRTAQAMLPGLTLQVDPIDGLREFQGRSETLSRRLTAYALPTMGLMLVFVMLVVSLTTNERRFELAVLRSRGASRRQLVGQVAVESAVLSAGALLIGLALSLFIASLMGRAQSFLDLSGPGLLTVGLTPAAWRTGLIIAIGAVVLLVLPIIGASRATVVTHAEMTARATIRPWWQRSSLDLIVIAVVIAIGYQFLRSDPDLGSGSLENPTLIIFPALVALAFGLIVLRVLPFLLGLAAKVLQYTSSLVALVATRRAARSPGSTYVPLLLLVVTISLAIFTASLAKTLDLQLFDETYHRIGADWSVMEYDSAAQPVVNGVEFPRILAPMEDFEAIEGVAEATRLQKTAGRLTTVSRSTVDITFFGIDAESFSDIGFYRADYAARLPVPDSVARIAASPDAILVHPSLGLAIGDTVETQTLYEGRPLTRSLIVAGYLNHFPTWYPETDEALVIGNLDPVFDGTGEEGEYHVWLLLEPDAAHNPAKPLVTDIQLLHADSPLVEIPRALAQPERQGVFGLLTIGFIASILISIMGFFFATLFKVRGSMVQLGALQALGMKPRQVTGVVVTELALLMGSGLAAGLAAGWALSRWLIVRLVGDADLTAVPRLLAEIDRVAMLGVSILIGVLFLTSAFVLVTVLRRMKVFEALKLGEAP